MRIKGIFSLLKDKDVARSRIIMYICELQTNKTITMEKEKSDLKIMEEMERKELQDQT